MNKALQKSMVASSRLRNKFFENKTHSNESAYKKQRNCCVSLFLKEKESFFQNLNTKKITDNKKFWKTVKLFSSKQNFE